jgi:hypothetical protein
MGVPAMSYDTDTDAVAGVATKSPAPLDLTWADWAKAIKQANQHLRFIDPTNCERDYAIAEQEFTRALQAYKQSSGRMFPTWSEILEVLTDLGYEKPGGALIRWVWGRRGSWRGLLGLGRTETTRAVNRSPKNWRQHAAERGTS